ncbi:MAG: PhoX family protein [Gammaproteobacteria bacterium]|nr:PhoX family protein [Gammaproteobacteria bacterium]
MIAATDPLYPLHLDAATANATLAGVAYLSSIPLKAKDGRTVVYLTETSQPEHLYKFVGPLEHGGAQPHGTLYVASLGAAGHGRWLPLVLARYGLSHRDGYCSAKAILADASDAARRAGATRIAGLFAPQARPGGGHLLLCDHVGPALVWREALGDAASLSFAWDGAQAHGCIATNLHLPRESGLAEQIHG